MKVLDLQSYQEYQGWLESQPSEWDRLDKMCRITISTFYRDWAVFDYLKDVLLPYMAQLAESEGRSLRCWSAGCASGEEAYTISLIWHLTLKEKFPKLDFRILATDVEEHMLDRAKKGCYQGSSLRGLPETWLAKAFDKKENKYCIKAPIKTNIQWHLQDIRKSAPKGEFDIILCRNLVATYFDLQLQIQTFSRFKNLLRPDGILVLGSHEKLPEELDGFSILEEKLRIYQLSQRHN